MKARFLPFLFVLLLGTAAFAKGDKLTLGVFLPTTMADGQARFDVAQKLGDALGQASGATVVARNFGRFEDFAKAVSSGRIDVAITDGWAAAQLGKGTPVALGQVAGSADQTWSIITYRKKGVVKDFSGKRIAVPRGARALDAKFVTNVMFVGDFDARRHFRIVSVPNVESGLRALQSKSVDTALVPTMHVPTDARVLFRSAPLPGVVALVLKGDPTETQNDLVKMPATDPLEKFVAAGPDALGDLRTLMMKGPPKRTPVVAESPVLRIDTTPFISFRNVGLVLPSFTELMVSPKDHPDD